MNMMLQTVHPIRLRAPFYHGDERAALHRYLDTEFINRFRQDLDQQRFQLPQFGAWLDEERHSRHDDKPVLRLPTHRAFHFCSDKCVAIRYIAVETDRRSGPGVRRGFAARQPDRPADVPAAAREGAT